MQETPQHVDLTTIYGIAFTTIYGMTQARFPRHCTAIMLRRSV